jgi:DNA-directed RNA polymerase specialized sigma24 family protein
LTLPPFQELLDAHGRDVYRFVRAIVGHDDADDTYQETWIAALRAYPRLRDASNLRGWVFTVAHRKALDRLRARRRAPVPVSELPETDGGGSPPGPIDDALWALVRALPDKQRTAVALRFVAEVAEMMGTSEDAARRNVHEGLKRLRTEYEQ